MGDYPTSSQPVEGSSDRIAEHLRSLAAAGAGTVQLVVDPIVPASLDALGEVIALVR
jgi:hypothetical protein